jgi:phosphatidylserine/phosphatidylglycerophosphate/cardiolipin synthase-like enzyme
LSTQGTSRLLSRPAADRAFTRAGGAPLVEGNAVRILRDGRENYAAWEAAIASASRHVHVEMYMIHEDEVGRRFRDRLADKAREGVAVRLLYDWFGSIRSAFSRFYAPLVEAGGEVRVWNPPRLTAPLAWLQRNHRKLLAIDGRVAFVSGLCIGRPWEGDPARGLAPWRDTGVELRGPAVADAEHVFARSWVEAGGPLPEGAVPAREEIEPAGSVAVRVIPTEPATANMLRLDLLVAALARRRLWITDAYFLAAPPFVEALRQAALDGVDVRLLLPRSSDIPWIAAASRISYRALIEAGVRVFEWNGPMLHAKTAVADGTWTRVGSTNLNLASWIGNWELDVTVEDETIAREMETYFLEDLERATEVVVLRPSRPPAPRLARFRRGRRWRPPAAPAQIGAPGRWRQAGRGARLARRVSGFGRSVGAAVTGSRPLEADEHGPLVLLGILALAIAAVGFWQPWLVAWPLSLLLGAASAYFLARGAWLRLSRPRLPAGEEERPGSRDS